MAKSKKSKILAMALCAGVMAGIYASPVMAAMKYIDGSNYFVTNGTINTGTFIGGTYNGGTFNGELLFHGNANMENLLVDGVSVNAAAANGVYGDRLTVGGTTLDFVQVNQTISNTSGITSHSDGKVTTIEGAFSVNKNGYIYNKNGSFKVTRDGAITASTYNGVKLAIDGNKVLVGDIDVSEMADNTEGIVRLGETTTIEKTVSADKWGLKVLDENGKTVASINSTNGGINAANGKFHVYSEGQIEGTALSLVNNGAQNVYIDNSGTARFGDEDGANVRVENGVLTVNRNSEPVAALSENGLTLTSSNDIRATLNAEQIANLNNVVQEDGNVVGTTVKTTSGADLDVVDGRTQNMWADEHQTNFSHSVNVEGSFSSGNGAVSLKGNWGQEASIELRDAEKNVYALTATKLGTINNVITDDGAVVSQGDVTSTDGTNTYSLNKVGSELNNLDQTITNTNKNVAGIKRNDAGTVTTIEGKTTIGADGTFSTAGGAFSVDANGNVISGTINGYNVAEIDSTVDQIAHNVAGIERAGETTTIEQDFSVNGVNNTFGSANGSFTVNTEDGSFTAANGNFVVSTDGAVNTTGIITADDFTSSGGYTLNKVGDQLSQLDSNLGTTTANVAGIKRTGETTTIEETFAVNGTNDTFGSANGKFTVNTADGSFIAANGNFIVDGSGTVYSEKAVIAGGAVTLENGQGSTSIKGGAITAQTLNGKDINSLVTSDDMEHELKNVGGIIRDAEKGAAPGEGTTTIEGVLSVNGQDKQISMFGGNGPVFEFDSTDNSTDVYGRMNFVNGSDVSFGYNSKLTGAFTSTNFEDLANKLDDVYNRTQGISYDEATGSTTISDKIGTADGAFESGNSITVGNDGITMNGDTVMNGDSTTGNQGGSGDGSVTNPDSDHIVNGGQEVNNGQTVNGGQVVNGGQTVNGDAQFNDQVTVGDTDGNQTVINGGDVTVDNSVTVGSGENQTIVNNDGVTVGGADGTSINHDEVRVGGEGGSYMNDTDVVSGEGVSLNQTAERVGNLENRVGELEDRIDKVGAMAAAIANLRTMGYDPAAPTEVAVGIGQYRDETGAALGLFHYPNRDFMLSLSVSTSGDEVMGGIGATWKFGRKSPEKVAEIKKAQAEADARRAEEAKLAKAEEMKQAAKEAKIKAQQERHAKLAAERAAQAEAAK